MSLRSVGKTKDTTTITVRDPETREPIRLLGQDEPMTVTLYGPFSEHYKNVLRDQQQRRMTENVGRVPAKMSDAEIEEFSRELLFRCIESWTIVLDEGGEVVPLERDAVEAVFEEFPWLRDDIDAALGNRGNFLARPAPL